jgi:KDO2-lipid IV(A) lauroyltransferase
MAQGSRRRYGATPGLAELAQWSDVTRWAGLATTGAYRTGALAARFLPDVVASGLATPFGFGASMASPERRAMIERQLRRVDPSLRGVRMRRAVQDSFDWYARYWIESFRLPSLSRRTVDRGFRTVGFHNIDDALAAGTGVILALPHLGGWEWAGRWLADQGYEVTVIVERLDPPELFDWFVELREELGMRVVALGPSAGSTIMAALRNNHIVCLLSDRDIAGGGAVVEFFGEETTLPGGPATIGLRMGAPVLPTAVYFTDRLDGHLGYICPPLPLRRAGGRLRDDVRRGTQDLAFQLETLIRRAPTQWHMFQPNWPSDPGYPH